MSLKDFVILLLIICIFGSILFGSVSGFFGYVSSIFDNVADGIDTTEGYVYRGGPISSDQFVDSSGSGGSGSSSGSGGSGSGSGSGSGGSSHEYGDWQKDYMTNMTDSEGNPIWLSIVSTSGGQLEPGIYEVYWSSLGPINQTRVG